MNKFIFGAIALAASAAIAFVALQPSPVEQTTSPEKAPTEVSAVEGCSGCASCAAKKEVAAKEASCSGCTSCSAAKSEVAATGAPAGCCSSSKGECCGSCDKSEMVSTDGAKKECCGACNGGDASKCCQMAKKAEGEETETVGTTSEENQDNQ